MIQCKVIRISTGEILNPNYQISEQQALDGPASLGLEPDVKVLIVHTPFEKPAYDSRYYTLQVTEEVTTDAHPVYGLWDQYKITYATPRRAVEETKAIAENAELDALNELYPPNMQLLLNTLAIAVLFRASDGLQLNAKETAIKNKVMAAGVKIWQNRDVLKAKLDAIDANQQPDLEDGYDRTPVA